MKITVDNQELQRAFRDLQRLARDPEPAFKDMGEYYLGVVDDRFKKEKDHKGQPWKALSPKYAARKRKIPTAVQKKNQLTGLMRAGMNYQTSPKEVRIGSDKIYAARRNKDRPFLTPNEADEKEFVTILEEHVQAAWEGTR